MYPPHIISRFILAWILLISFLITYSITLGTNDSTFFKIGPHSNLLLFGIRIDNLYKYFATFNYMIVSAGMRALEMQMITPWVLQNVQTKEPKSEYTAQFAHEIILIQTLYKWIDWLAYTIILLTQIDLFFIEMTADLIISCFITQYYLDLPGPIRT